MKRILHNSNLGFYTQTFFRIHLYKNVTFNHMSEEDYAVLAHEYIHFLQDISTTYGAFMAYSSSRKDLGKRRSSLNKMEMTAKELLGNVR